jgi:hypothetical protein
MCDNFFGGAAGSYSIPPVEPGGKHPGRRRPPAFPKGRITAMVEELEQEYAALKDKVRDLREYL